MSELSAKISIAQFLTSERDRLVGYVRHLIDDAGDRDGEDIVQDVALNLYCRADVLMPIETISSYVYQSLRNKVTDYLRRRKNMVFLDEPADNDTELSLICALSDNIANVEKEVTRSELREKIFSAIDSLSNIEKAIVIETELNGRSYRELSEEWGIPLGTLLARKSRALVKMRELLQEFKP
jgi:RNA polymerase sigma factor (sigma-70 family)